MKFEWNLSHKQFKNNSLKSYKTYIILPKYSLIYNIDRLIKFEWNLFHEQFKNNSLTSYKTYIILPEELIISTIKWDSNVVKNIQQPLDTAFVRNNRSSLNRSQWSPKIL